MTLKPLFAERLFELLTESAEENHRLWENLRIQLRTNSPSEEATPADRPRGDEIGQETCEQLVRTPVAGLDREDIADLSFALSEINRIARRFADHLAVSSVLPGTVGLSSQAQSLERGARVLVEMVAHLRSGLNLRVFKDLHAKLVGCLEEAEDDMVASRASLLTSPADELKLVVLDDLYRCLDEVIDAFQQAGQITNRICLANN